MKIANLKMRTRIGLGYGLVLLLLMAVAITGYTGMSHSNDELHHILNVNVKKMELLEEMSQSVHIVSRVIRTIALLHDNVKEIDMQKAKITEAHDAYNNAFAALEKMSTDEGDKAFFVKLAEDMRVSSEINNKFIEAAKANPDSAAQLLINEAAPPTNKLLDSTREQINLQKAKNKHEEEAASSDYHSASIFMLIFTGAAIFIGIFTGWFITRSILDQLGGEPDYVTSIAQRITEGDLSAPIYTKADDHTSLLHTMKLMRDSLANIVAQVRTGTDTIATASSQIATGNLDLSSRTEMQASSLEETASSMEELTSTVKQNADNALQANQLARSASDIAVQGGVVVSHVIDTMGAINESAKKIVDIISVIDGIAFQTNILALNAAVEAARAGEQGRGFAVVASEVRNLAQRSAGAAKEIKALIGDSVEKVDAGSKLVDQAGETINEVVASVKRVSDIISEISAASGEQTAGIDQINQAIGQMDAVTQQNASLVEEAAAAATSLQDQANDLANLVSVFKIDMNTQATVTQTAQQSLRKKRASVTPIKKATLVAKQPPAVTKQPRRVAISAPESGGDWEEF